MFHISHPKFEESNRFCAVMWIQLCWTHFDFTRTSKGVLGPWGLKHGNCLNFSPIYVIQKEIQHFFWVLRKTNECTEQTAEPISIYLIDLM